MGVFALVDQERRGKRERGWIGLSRTIDVPGLRSAYFHGTEYPAFEDYDYTGRKASLVPTGTGADEYFTEFDNTRFVTLPFTPNDVLAVRGEMTLVSVFKLRSTASAQRVALVGDYEDLGEQSVLLGFRGDTSSNYRAFANDNSAEAVFTAVSASASSGVVWETLAGIYTQTTLQTRRRLPPGEQTSSVLTLTTPPAGARPFRIGRSYAASTYNDGVDIAATLIFSRALTIAQLDILYDQLKTWFDARAVGVVL